MRERLPKEASFLRFALDRFFLTKPVASSMALGVISRYAVRIPSGMTVALAGIPQQVSQLHLDPG